MAVRPLLVLALLLFALLDLHGLTGEESRAAQVRGLGHWLSGRLRPYPATAPLQPVRDAGLAPFGLNTFLQSETEPDKVAQSLDMIAAGGFRWIRQEFPWEDLEIHGNDWFVDLRNNEIRSSWAKYDRIVALAEARDLALIVRLSNPPAWSRATGDEMGEKGPPDALERYGEYVAAVASRYRGRVRYYQVWNEPNCCEEWGRRPVSPEQYVAMLRVAHARIKAADPDAIVLTAPLAPTIELDYAPGGLNDFLFLQRMYDAGAKDYFDVLAVQDYGLWSGPEDRRMRPRVINYARPEYLRDIMLRNGDGEKAIWASEIGWNATPPDSGIPQSFGYAPESLRGPYLAAAFARQQQEWPWMGVTTVWFFKPTDESEASQPQYYFRLVEPDFTPLPAWDALTAYIQSVEPTLYRGFHQESHWALHDGGAGWPLVAEPSALFGQVARGTAGDSLHFAAEGQALTLVLHPGSAATLLATVGGQPRRFVVADGAIRDADGQRVGDARQDAGVATLHLPLGPLPPGRSAISLTVEAGTLLLDGLLLP